MNSDKLNADIDKLILYDAKKGSLHSNVCLICDKLMNPKEQKLVSMKIFLKYAVYLKGSSSIPISLRQCYRFNVDEVKKIPGTRILEDCLLSPRSKLVQTYKNRNTMVMCCQECRGGLSEKLLKQGKLPRFAIANNLAIGIAPVCLERLNEIEIALLSQARFRGHLFTYWGGCHRSIKGWHSFHEVDPNHTIAVLEKVEHFTNSKNIAVVLCGPFTSNQKEKVLRKVQVNVEWVLDAFAWLKANNKLYENLPFPRIEAPAIFDKSYNVESDNSDIETKEEIKVVFPDGTVQTGGCSDGVQFDKAVAEIRSKCANSIPFLTSRPSQKILRDYEDENLMRAFPKQFPYGFGYHEDFNIKSSQNGYLKHLISLSIPAFHEADFVLVVHNMFERSRALNGALWQVMGGKEKCDVTEEELNFAISQQLNGLPVVNGPGKDFLNSVQTVKRNMAHTNASAQTAQAKFLSLTHHFGCPKALFTVSFDDSLDIRILAMSGKEDAISWIASLDSLSSNEVAKEMDLLNAVRCKYPGLCALNFEYLLGVVLEHIVGENDLRTGIFGTLSAYGLAVEEQGRKTLHCHILVYTTDWNTTLRDLHASNSNLRKATEKKIIKFVDSIMTTELIPYGVNIQQCPKCEHGILDYVEGQQLRNLRHKVGCQGEKGYLAHCSTCESNFHGDELAMKRAVKAEKWDMVKEEMKCYVGHQILKATTPIAPCIATNEMIGLVNYYYNHHLHHHTKTCFKKGDEGRCYLPDIQESETHILHSENLFEVFEWTGKSYKQSNVTIRAKRHAEDAYTNSHCKVISACKAPSNSNISITTGARSTIYASCYAAKGTQKEDSAEWKRLGSYVANRFLEERNENTLFEGLSRLMGAVIVGTSEHVCAAPMAAYLVRNHSRFKFSVNFKYIPVREVIHLITEDDARNSLKMAIVGHDTGCFLMNEAFHYLQRPQKNFEDYSLVDFFENFEIVRKGGDTENDDKEFFDFDDPDYPGYAKQVIKKRKEKVTAQFPHWIFPDACSFGMNILKNTTYPVNTSVENYCRAVLVLFHPMRSIEDITIEGSFYKKFRYFFHQGGHPRVQEILSNIQMFYNSTRLPAKDDPLNNMTNPFESSSLQVQEEEDDNLDNENGGDFFDGIFNLLGGTDSSSLENIECECPKMSLYKIRKEGLRGCGFAYLPSIEASTPRLPATFLSTIAANHVSAMSQVSMRGVNARDRPKVVDLMTLIYSSTTRKIENGTSVLTDQVDANGTVLSIIEWSHQQELNLDDEQQLAFQIVTAAYVHTYYVEADHEVEGGCLNYDKEGGGRMRAQMRHDYNEEMKKLHKLARLGHSISLRMFLDGAGGSGKSRVVGELLKYAQNFTSNLNLTFDMRTIVVTAMSGVAATSIGGETLHSAAAFNRKIAEDDVSWANARLLIIDEVSFMNVQENEKLDSNLKCLMRRYNVLFGGIHILFCGDFRQLEPVTGKPLYSPYTSDKMWVNSINCYIELQGMHRFKEDPEWGQILKRIRNDNHSRHDIEAINMCAIGLPQQESRTLPGDVSYCVYGNTDRTAINAGIFSNVLEAHTKKANEQPPYIIAVKASNMMRVTKSKTKVEMGVQDKQYVYENCGAHRVRARVQGRQGHFVDPMLKLYHHIPLMFVSNEDVPNGHANGTRVLLEGIVLKEDIVPSTLLIDGLKCPTVEASSIDHLVCSLVDKKEKIFYIRPKTFNCSVRAPVPKDIGGYTEASVNLNVSLFQFPVLVNNATTGHKLQGQTKKNLIISVWSKKKNWNYVALSRVQTRKGLYLVTPLPPTTDFSMSNDLRQMLQALEDKSPEYVEWNLNEERTILKRKRRDSDNLD
jgi:PIF1-like helicase/Helitron helicase-like domain at N-terminus